MKLSYAIFNQGDLVVGNKSMGPVLIHPDPLSVLCGKAQFSIDHSVKLVEADRNTNMIIELQIPDKRDPNRFKPIGWSLINLFSFEQVKLNKGTFKLPLYALPINPMLSMSDIYTLTPISGYMCIKISEKKDQISDLKPDMHPTEGLDPLGHKNSEKNSGNLEHIAPKMKCPEEDNG